MTAVQERFDVTVIGSGPGGYVAAIRAAQLGRKVALVEKDPALGGTCLHLGCIPTKALLEAAHVFDLARRAGEFGIRAEAVSFDWRAVQGRKQAVVDAQAKGLNFLMRKNNITVLEGTGRLDGPGRVTVVAKTGKKTACATGDVIIATGSTPRALPHLPRDGKQIVDSNDILRLEKVPASLIIVGAGAVGMEFASIFARFGAECTVVEMLPRALPVEDEDVGKEIERAFRKRKIPIRTGSLVESVEVKEARIRARLVPAQSPGKADGSGGDGGRAAAETLAAEMLLVAVGRAPVTEDIGLATVGLAAERGFIPVDERMRTKVKGIYAIGDVVSVAGRSHPMLAHVAMHEGIVAAETLAGAETRPVNYDRVPSCTYSDPEVACIGLSESEAAKRGYEVKTSRFPFTPVARARITGETDGFVKIVADGRYDEVLGVHIIGPCATELIAEAGAALGLESTSEELVRIMHAHPTLAEAMGEAAHGVHGKPIHI